MFVFPRKEIDDDLYSSTNLTIFDWNVEKGFEKDTPINSVPWRSLGKTIASYSFRMGFSTLLQVLEFI